MSKSSAVQTLGCMVFIAGMIRINVEVGKQARTMSGGNASLTIFGDPLVREGLQINKLNIKE